MAAFSPRLSANGIWQNPYWYSDNVFYQSGYGLPNCTCYAYGRLYEVTNIQPSLRYGNAENWYPYTNAYPKGQTPLIGSIICWQGGGIGGHVAFVERVLSNGAVFVSESAYQQFIFRNNIDLF